MGMAIDPLVVDSITGRKSTNLCVGGNTPEILIIF